MEHENAESVQNADLLKVNLTVQLGFTRLKIN
jgi:hypothetical protein